MQQTKQTQTTIPESDQEATVKDKVLFPYALCPTE